MPHDERAREALVLRQQLSISVAILTRNGGPQRIIKWMITYSKALSEWIDLYADRCESCGCMRHETCCRTYTQRVFARQPVNQVMVPSLPEMPKIENVNHHKES